MLKRYLSFFGLAIALAYAPGPDILFVLAQSLASGWQSGSFVTLGLTTGLCFHVALAAFGVAAVLKRRPALFKAVTWFGAAYLTYLGILTWRSAAVVSAGPEVVDALPPLRLYLRGVTMNVLNPKVMLFFLALVPQFVVPAKGRVALQFVSLGLTFAAATLLAFHTVAFGGGAISRLIARSPEAMVVLRYFSAVVMFGIAGWIGWMNLRKEKTT